MRFFLAIFMINLLITSCAYNKEELPKPKKNSGISPPQHSITYTQHTKRILDNYCISCHSPLGSISSSLLHTYTDAKIYADNGRIQVRTINIGDMPTLGSPLLTVAEKDTLQMWLNQNAPE